MIRINLLDESQIPKESHDAAELGEKTIHLGGPWFKNWMVLGPSIAGFVFVLYFGYYWFAIRSPLSEIAEDLAANQKVLETLKPQVKETETLNGALMEAKKKSDEFEKFLISKKNWARVLNVLSDELPDEILFKKLDVSGRLYQKKRKTAAGLVSDSMDCLVMGIELEVSEEFQSKVSAYMKKIREEAWIKTFLIGMEDSGMNWNQSQKIFSTRVELFFSKSGFELPQGQNSSSTNVSGAQG